MKYYDMAKEHHSYTLGTVLHPALRSQWFSTLSDTDAVTKAETLFRFAAESYLDDATPDTMPQPQNLQKTSQPSTSASFLTSACAFTWPSPGVVTAASKMDPKVELTQEIDRYLSFHKESPPKDSAEMAASLMDPLGWWKENASRLPTVARMARDNLAIPATSVSVERVFWKARHICDNLRSSLKAETVAQALLTKVWVRSGLFAINPEASSFRKQHAIAVDEFEDNS